MKKICLIVLFMSVVLLMGCTKPIPEEELEEIIADYEDIKASKVDIESFEESKNEIIVEAELNIKEEDIGYKTVIEYTLEKKDGEVEIEDVDVLEDREYYPLQSCDFKISLDDIEYGDSNNTIIASDNNVIINILQDDVNLDSKPYTENITFELVYENAYSYGTGTGYANLVFDTKYGEWKVDVLKQDTPIKLEWIDGHEFPFSEKDFTDYLDDEYSIFINEIEHGYDVEIDNDDELEISVIREPYIVGPDIVPCDLKINAFNGIVDIPVEIRCYYEMYNNAWYINETEIINQGDISLPNIIGTWTGYYNYDYKDPTKKVFVKLEVDEIIESNGDYLGTIYYYSDYESGENGVIYSYYKILISFYPERTTIMLGDDDKIKFEVLEKIEGPSFGELDGRDFWLNIEGNTLFGEDDIYKRNIFLEKN